MKYYLLKPEVAGVWGERTQTEQWSTIPQVSKLHYQFDGWLGDVLLESFPCFVITQEAKDKIEELGATGVTFDNVEISTSEEFEQLNPTVILPRFAWLKPNGSPGVDDFGLIPTSELVVSERVLNLLRSLGLCHAEISEFVGKGRTDKYR